MPLLVLVKLRNMEECASRSAATGKQVAKAMQDLVVQEAKLEVEAVDLSCEGGRRAVSDPVPQPSSDGRMAQTQKILLSAL